MEERVGGIVGNGVDALRVVAARHEVPEEEVYGFNRLGGVPAAVPVEDAVQSLSPQQVAYPYAVGGPLLGPLVVVPTLLFVGFLQGYRSPASASTPPKPDPVS